MLRTRLDAAVKDCARERSKSTLLADQLTCAQEQIRQKIQDCWSLWTVAALAEVCGEQFW